MSQTESGGRYQRSFGGLVGATVVTVLAVVALVVARNLISDDVEIEPADVAYLEKVEQAQGAGLEPIYPPTLPEGWQATGAEVTPGQPPGFGLALLTDDEAFVGIRQSGLSVDDLLDEHVAETVDEGEPFAATGSVAAQWQTYSDEGGDLAYAAQVGETTVLVYGSADRADLQALVDSLTTRPLTPAAPSR